MLSILALSQPTFHSLVSKHLILFLVLILTISDTSLVLLLLSNQDYLMPRLLENKQHQEFLTYRLILVSPIRILLFSFQYPMPESLMHFLSIVGGRITFFPDGNIQEVSGNNNSNYVNVYYKILPFII